MAQDEEIPPPANVQDVVDTVVTYDEDGNEIVSTETKTTSVAASTSGVTTAITGAANLHVSADATKVESKPVSKRVTFSSQYFDSVGNRAFDSNEEEGL